MGKSSPIVSQLIVLGGPHFLLNFPPQMAHLIQNSSIWQKSDFSIAFPNLRTMLRQSSAAIWSILCIYIYTAPHMYRLLSLSLSLLVSLSRSLSLSFSIDITFWSLWITHVYITCISLYIYTCTISVQQTVSRYFSQLSWFLRILVWTDELYTTSCVGFTPPGTVWNDQKYIQNSEQTEDI